MWKLGFLLVETKHRSFEDAFRALYKKINKKPIQGQLLETAIWIIDPKNKHYSFYEAREKAYEEGIISNGILAKPLEETHSFIRALRKTDN